jgi:TolA-binding protein
MSSAGKAPDIVRSFGRNGRTISAGLLILSLLLVSPALCADDPLDDYRLAVGFYNKEQWKLAAESFQGFLKDHGQHAKAENARYYYGLTLLKLDDFKQAREILRQFVKDFPKGRDTTAARYWIGHASYFLDDFAGAETDLGAFVEVAGQDPLMEWALPYLADTELRLKKPEAARTHFQQALDAFPKGDMAEDSRFGLARSYELLKKTPEAIKAYQVVAANREGSRAAEAQLSLGDLHFDAGDFSAAAADFADFEQRFPESPQLVQAQLNRGFALYQLRDYQQASRQFDKAATVDKHAAEALLWKGLCLKSLGDFAQAISVLQPAYEKYRDQPLAEKLLFQWAVCAERRGARDAARALFVEVADRWPKGILADESLHAASLAAVDAGKLPEAEVLFARFDRDFPGNRLRLRQEILKGRVLAAKGDFAGAGKQFHSVVAASEIESTRQQARYFLADALQKQSQHAQVLEVTEPLAAQVQADQALADFAGVFVLRAVSQLALAKAVPARAKPSDDVPEKTARCLESLESVRKYRELAPGGPLSAQAQAVAAVAGFLAHKSEAAAAALESLRKNHPRSPELEQALFDSGTIAFSWDDFKTAEVLFTELAAWPQDSRRHAGALADLGWSVYKQQKYAEAVTVFGRLLKEHADDRELVPEAAFMVGKSLQDLGKIPEAQAAFADAWKRPGTAHEVYLAGLQSARLLARLKKTAESDAAYEDLIKRFPGRSDGDKVLNEWAAVDYDAENYSRADEIFRRLISEYPASDLADNAQLSLAESDLVAGKLDQARNQFTALVKNPASDDGVQQRSLYQMIRIDLETRRWDDLRKDCDLGLQRFPEGTYRYETELRRAEADFNLASNPADFKAARDRLLELKSLKENAGLKAAAWFPQVWVMLAETEWRLKDYDAVAATVAEFRNWNPQSPLLYQADEVLGRSFKSQAMWVEAREAFERVVKDPHGKLTESAAKSQFMIADTYFWEKNFPEALKEFMKVDILYKFPELQAAALYQAGACQEELQRWKDAARTYDEMLKKFPESEHAAKARDRLGFVRKRLAAG